MRRWLAARRRAIGATAGADERHAEGAATNRLTSPWVRAFVIWSAVLLIASILVAIAAIVGFLRADDACFFQLGPCPELGDENFTRLEFAVFGIPLIWLVGVIAGAVGHAIAARRRQRGSR